MNILKDLLSLVRESNRHEHEAHGRTVPAGGKVDDSLRDMMEYKGIHLNDMVTAKGKTGKLIKCSMGNSTIQTEDGETFTAYNGDVKKAVKEGLNEGIDRAWKKTDKDGDREVRTHADGRQISIGKPFEGYAQTSMGMMGRAQKTTYQNLKYRASANDDWENWGDANYRVKDEDIEKAFKYTKKRVKEDLNEAKEKFHYYADEWEKLSGKDGDVAMVLVHGLGDDYDADFEKGEKGRYHPRNYFGVNVVFNKDGKITASTADNLSDNQWEADKDEIIKIAKAWLKKKGHGDLIKEGISKDDYRIEGSKLIFTSQQPYAKAKRALSEVWDDVDDLDEHTKTDLVYQTENMSKTLKFNSASVLKAALKRINRDEAKEFDKAKGKS